ncbi:unnamed protein product [Vitrella brassicaformis CCMP3155]|uniref:Oxidation resistance protein 1 n=1 Tax=Vitrella brassicaformis (strain CCMP3155) TaxID=1169540 RepID=A0A0G4EME9_VITBC|nr:unnamed protein product [Vitrella brassicaformis CCMP3155]|eukprot:CEL98344.1 unnamed protein product [Vitrella brassicaformis CCMP3155]
MSEWDSFAQADWMWLGMWAITSAEDHHNHDDNQAQAAHGGGAGTAAVNHDDPHHQTGAANPLGQSHHVGNSTQPDCHGDDTADDAATQEAASGTGEVTIGKRLQLVDEFERRKDSEEAISMPQFAKEKGIPPKRFKQWRAKLKKQREAGMRIVDPTKKRNRQPKYQQIEDEMRQWMANHDDLTKVPPKAIRAKAMEIANRLGISDFSASDTWIKNFRKRCQQNPPGPSASPAPSLAHVINDMQGPLPSSVVPPAAAAPGTDDTDGMALMREEELHVAVQEWVNRMPGPDTSDDIQVRGEANYTLKAVSTRCCFQAAEGASVSAAAAAVDPPFPMHPPHPHPLPIPLTHLSAAAPAAAAAASREADGFIGPTTDLSRQTTTCPPDDDGAASGRPLDTQSQTSEPSNTMNIVPLEGRLTNERPPTKIHRSNTRSHREGPPSVVLSRSSVKSVFTMTADDRLSDIPEDGDGIVSVSDGVPDGITALSSRSTTDEDDQSPDPQVIVGSSLSSTECAALRSVLALAMLDECEFTLLYRASRDGAEYGDLLRCVGDTEGLVLVIREDKYVFGVYMSDGIQVPDDPKGENVHFCDGWHFSLAGHFEKPTKMLDGRKSVWVAGREGAVGGAKLWIGRWIEGRLMLGYKGGAADDMRSCRQLIDSDRVPEGYVGVRDEDGDALFGGSEHFVADEVEAIRVDGRSLLPLKVIEGATFDALQSAALYRFLRPTTASRLKLIYRASSDGSSYGDLLRCVGDASGLVFIIRKDKYVFGAFISAGIRLPDDRKGKKKYRCDMWHFSLAGHFAKGPTKMEGGNWPVYVAGREGTVRGAKLLMVGGGWLELGYEGGAAADDIRSCCQGIPWWDVPEGYVGVRNGRGSAFFGGSAYFMADEVEVLRVVF